MDQHTQSGSKRGGDHEPSRPDAGNLQLDVSANRAAQKWTPSELFRRFLWEVSGPLLFVWTPRQLWAWRRVVLRAFGAHIGAHVRIHPTVRIAIPWNVTVGDYSAVGDRAILYSLGPIKIGCNVTISQLAHICAGSHDFRDPGMKLLKPSVQIDDGAWICADAFIGPGVKVHQGAVVGARAVVTKDVEERLVVAGNPAVAVSTR